MFQSASRKYLDDHHDRFKNELIEFLRIPSISSAAEHAADVGRAAQWMSDKFNSMGINNVGILSTAGHPVVYGEWLNGGNKAPVVLIYGHYDVQSAEPLEDWNSQPFEPEVRNGNLYARGASDMKGQTLAAVNAVEAVIKTGNPPINIKFLIEGEEEIGSKHLNEFLVRHREKLASDYSLNTDAGGMPDADTPAICYSLRGGAGFSLNILGPDHDLHSGEYGGVVQNPIHVMSRLIADLHDKDGRVTLPGFYERVREMDAEERAELAKLPFTEEFLIKQSGAPALWGDPGFSPVERIGARPTMDVVQFQAGQPKTAIPARASALFSFRLVPDQDPGEVHQQFRKYLEKNIPSTVTFDLQLVRETLAVITDRTSRPVLAMKNALKAVFGRDPILQRSGGGIGAVSMMKKNLGIDSVLTGFSLHDDNFHGPNEKLHLPTWEKGMKALVHFFRNLVDEKEGSSQ